MRIERYGIAVLALWLASTLGTAAPSARPAQDGGVSPSRGTRQRMASEGTDPAVQTFDKARLLYQQQRFDDARALFAEIVDQHVTSKVAVPAAMLLFECLSSLKRTEELLATAERLSTQPALTKDPELHQLLIGLKADGLVRDARDHENAHNFEPCARAFVAAANLLPKHSHHAQRLHNAYICFQAAGLAASAQEVRARLMEDHPNDPLTRQLQLRTAPGR